MKPITIRRSGLGAARRARAIRAVQSIRRKAARDGTNRLTMREINAEVAAVRQAKASARDNLGAFDP